MNKETQTTGQDEPLWKPEVRSGATNDESIARISNLLWNNWKLF